MGDTVISSTTITLSPCHPFTLSAFRTYTLGIHVVTDSTWDLPTEFVNRYGLSVVPAVLNVDGKSYRDGIDISRSDFYQRLPHLKELPTTSVPCLIESMRRTSRRTDA